MAASTKIQASVAAAAGYPAAEQGAIASFREHKHACIILGATGSVGKAIVRDVMESDAFEKVTLLVRREVQYEGPHSEKLENFRKIDYDYVLSAAKLFKSANPSKPLQFHYCSSGGANASSMFLYPRTKGEVENALRELNFARCGLFRPGFLDLEEPRNDSRWAESLFRPIARHFPSVMTPVSVCARAMRRWAIDSANKEGTVILENAEILKLGA
ncbi:hypothetical protein HDV00_003658 [Rhizophlyctis rosea]|nr:hypothetical protein HDV00_003658 [Rhizophlyctis rosea]